MGRYSTGAWNTDECLRIELSHLLKAKYLQRGKQTYGSLHWNCNGQPSGSINIFSSWPAAAAATMLPPYIRLTYTITNQATGEKENRDETIYLAERPSNLGKGKLLYFMCPVSGQYCRILYKAYNCPIWKSRQAYKNRIYYPCQQSSKREYANDRFWQLEKQIEKLKGKRWPGTYKGKWTKRAERLDRLMLAQERADNLRWQPEAFTLSLRKAIFEGLANYKP